MDTAEVLFACGIGLPVTAYLTWNFATFLAGKTYNKVVDAVHVAHGFGDRIRTYGPERPEVIIVGSGIVGSALAYALAREGRHVTVIERDLAQPDRIVGELLQPGGVRALRELCLEDCVAEIDAQIVEGYVVHDLETAAHVDISYPSKKGAVQEGRSFHHGRFVQQLRAAAARQSRVQYIEGTVSRLLEHEDTSIRGVEYRRKGCDDAVELEAPLTVVCDGHFSRFRKALVRENVRVASHFVGLLMEDCPQYKSRHAELVLGNPSPVLIYKISHKHTRVLVDIQGSLPKDMSHYMISTIGPQLPEHIRPHFNAAIESGCRIRSMPSSFLPARPQYRLGAIILGDAYNMRHPLTGGGMSVGLHDVIIWRDLLKAIPNFSDAKAIRKAQMRFHRRRKQSHAFVVNVLAQALYALFSASDNYLHSLRRACFDYFRLGGECVAGPVGLLSVLDPNPWTLIGHFFAVAFYCVYCNFRDIRSARSLSHAIFHPLGVLAKACNVIGPLIWSEMKTFFHY